MDVALRRVVRVAALRVVVVELNLGVGVQVPVEADRPRVGLATRARGREALLERTVVDLQVVVAGRHLERAEVPGAEVEVGARPDCRGAISRRIAGHHPRAGYLPCVEADVVGYVTLPHRGLGVHVLDDAGETLVEVRELR